MPSNLAETTPEIAAVVEDDLAVMGFAHEMIRKMSRSRDKGRTGWQTCPVDLLWTMLREHVEKGDPLDVACLAMMIHNNQSAAERAEHEQIDHDQFHRTVSA